MTCQICEMRLARDDADGEVQEHLERCPACRAMAEELRANAEALSALRDEPLPAVALPRRRRAYPWIAAAAAVIVLVAVLPRTRHTERPPALVPVAPQVAVVTPAPAAVNPAAAPKRQAVAKKQPLKIKMLTPDPDVVIYWMVEGE